MAALVRHFVDPELEFAVNAATAGFDARAGNLEDRNDFSVRMDVLRPVRKSNIDISCLEQPVVELRPKTVDVRAGQNRFEGTFDV